MLSLKSKVVEDAVILHWRRKHVFDFGTHFFRSSNCHRRSQSYVIWDTSVPNSLELVKFAQGLIIFFISLSPFTVKCYCFQPRDPWSHSLGFLNLGKKPALFQWDTYLKHTLFCEGSPIPLHLDEVFPRNQKDLQVKDKSLMVNLQAWRQTRNCLQRPSLLGAKLCPLKVMLVSLVLQIVTTFGDVF